MNFVEQKFNQKPRPVPIRWYRGLRLFARLSAKGHGIFQSWKVMRILQGAEMKGLRL